LVNQRNNLPGVSDLMRGAVLVVRMRQRKAVGRFCLRGHRLGGGVISLTLAAHLAASVAGCSVGPDFVTPFAPVAANWREKGDPSVRSKSVGFDTLSDGRPQKIWIMRNFRRRQLLRAKRSSPQTEGLCGSALS
jgi:hypothetical protein